jgi:hypothetical protein
MPERMQAECQCGIRTESHTIALLSARYWRRNGEESPRLPALRWPGSTSVVVFGQGRRSGRTPPPSAVCQDWRLAGLEQLFIGSDQSQPKHPRRGHQKPVGGIAVRQLHASRFLRDLVGDRSFQHGNHIQRICDPRLRIRMQCQPVFLATGQDLPQGDGRMPQLVPRILQRGSEPGGKSRSIELHTQM